MNHSHFAHCLTCLPLFITHHSWSSEVGVEKTRPNDQAIERSNARRINLNQVSHSRHYLNAALASPLKSRSHLRQNQAKSVYSIITMMSLVAILSKPRRRRASRVCKMYYKSLSAPRRISDPHSGAQSLHAGRPARLMVLVARRQHRALNFRGLQFLRLAILAGTLALPRLRGLTLPVLCLAHDVVPLVAIPRVRTLHLTAQTIPAKVPGPRTPCTQTNPLYTTKRR